MTTRRMPMAEDAQCRGVAATPRMVDSSGLHYLKTAGIRERTLKVNKFTDSRGVKFHCKESLFGPLPLKMKLEIIKPGLFSLFS